MKGRGVVLANFVNGLYHSSDFCLIDLIEREIQYTGPGHGTDAHVADRARLHAWVYNCITQLQLVLDKSLVDLVPSHASEKITNANTNRTRELDSAGCKNSKKGFGEGSTQIEIWHY